MLPRDGDDVRFVIFEHQSAQLRGEFLRLLLRGTVRAVGPDQRIVARGIVPHLIIEIDGRKIQHRADQIRRDILVQKIGAVVQEIIVIQVFRNRKFRLIHSSRVIKLIYTDKYLLNRILLTVEYYIKDIALILGIRAVVRKLNNSHIQSIRGVRRIKINDH